MINSPSEEDKERAFFESDKDRAAFEKALDGEDELGMVVRAHTHIENCVLDLLRLMVVSEKHVEKMQLDYAQRVRFLIAIGFKAQYESPLLAIGKLRNDFAHKLDFRITRDRAAAFYECFDGADKLLIQNAHARTREEVDPSVPPFKDLTPRAKITLMVVVLRTILRLALRQAPRPTTVQS